MFSTFLHPLGSLFQIQFVEPRPSFDKNIYSIYSQLSKLTNQCRSALTEKGMVQNVCSWSRQASFFKKKKSCSVSQFVFLWMIGLHEMAWRWHTQVSFINSKAAASSAMHNLLADLFEKKTVLHGILQKVAKNEIIHYKHVLYTAMRNIYSES